MNIMYKLSVAGLGLVMSGIALAQPPRDLTAEEANRTLVLTFYDQFFNRHETAEAATVIADNYRQHNPEVPDGKAPFVDYFTGFFKDNPNSKAKVVRSATEGDLVYLR